MTQLNGAPTRRRWDLGLNPIGNRFAYAFVVAILVNVALGSEPLSLAVGLALFLLLTAIVAVKRR